MEAGKRIIFPCHSLSLSGGRIVAGILENQYTGVKRALDWDFTIDFAPFEYRGMKVAPSFSIDGVPSPIRDWRNLVGLRADGEYGHDGIEASFYVWEHDYCSSFHLDVLERQGTSFLVEMSAVIEFSGSDRDDADPAMPVKARSWLPFEGLVLSLDTPPPDRKAAQEAAAEFVDLSTYTQDEADPEYFLPRL